MATFTEANQTRLQLKMKLSNYAWYNSSAVIADSDGYGIVIVVQQITNQIRKIIPPVLNDVNVKTESVT